MQMRWEHVLVLLWRGLSCVMSSVALDFKKKKKEIVYLWTKNQWVCFSLVAFLDAAVAIIEVQPRILLQVTQQAAHALNCRERSGIYQLVWLSNCHYSLNILLKTGPWLQNCGPKMSQSFSKLQNCTLHMICNKTQGVKLNEMDFIFVILECTIVKTLWLWYLCSIFDTNCNKSNSSKFCHK